MDDIDRELEKDPDWLRAKDEAERKDPNYWPKRNLEAIETHLRYSLPTFKFFGIRSEISPKPRLITENADSLVCAGLVFSFKGKREGTLMSADKPPPKEELFTTQYLRRVAGSSTGSDAPVSKSAPIAFDNEDHGYAAGFLCELFDRAAQAATDELRADKGVSTGIQKDHARRLLVCLRSLRAGLAEPVPSWKYLAEVLPLAGSLPTQPAQKRLIRQHQRAVAKLPRPNELNALLMKIKKDNPAYTWKHAAKALRDEVGKGIVEAINDEWIHWKDAKSRRHKAKSAALAARWSRLR